MTVVTSDFNYWNGPGNDIPLPPSAVIGDAAIVRVLAWKTGAAWSGGEWTNIPADWQMTDRMDFTLGTRHYALFIAYANPLGWPLPSQLTSLADVPEPVFSTGTIVQAFTQNLHAADPGDWHANPDAVGVGPTATPGVPYTFAGGWDVTTSDPYTDVVTAAALILPTTGSYGALGGNHITPLADATDAATVDTTPIGDGTNVTAIFIGFAHGPGPDIEYSISIPNGTGTQGTYSAGTPGSVSYIFVGAGGSDEGGDQGFDEYWDTLFGAGSSDQDTLTLHHATHETGGGDAVLGAWAYVYVASSATTWTIGHNLNGYPAVTAVDGSNQPIEGQVTYDSANQLTIRFASAQSGRAFLT